MSLVGSACWGDSAS